MGYLPRTARRREDVRRYLPSARSVVVTGTLYNVDRPYSVEVADPAEAVVSRYAWGDDYHEVVGRRLDRLLDWMRAEHGAPFEARACVDTAPVHERAYAQAAGVGWIGKNGCVINDQIGSWVFLGEIVCSVPLAPDAPAFDQCGGCTLCLEACPTGALVEPHVLDARRCISYLDDRAEAGDPGTVQGRDRHARVRMRRVPGRLPLEPVGPGERRPGLAAAGRARPSPARRFVPANRRRARGADARDGDDARVGDGAEA